MKPLLPAFLLLIAPAAAVAGPYDQPWAVITNDTAPSSDPKVRAVAVSRVDGEIVVKSRATVGPGLRVVTVDLPPRKGMSLGTQESFELNANPCMRYVVAARPDGDAGQDWKPFVRSAETIGECLAKFRGGTVPK
ncbi:MAG: hypothetical protein NDI88_13360 [Lysobacter sp.]|nr:hypothetical protein [Lysobacter sp.]